MNEQEGGRVRNRAKKPRRGGREDQGDLNRTDSQPPLARRRKTGLNILTAELLYDAVRGVRESVNNAATRRRHARRSSVGGRSAPRRSLHRARARARNSSSAQLFMYSTVRGGGGGGIRLNPSLHPARPRTGYRLNPALRRPPPLAVGGHLRLNAPPLAPPANDSARGLLGQGLRGGGSGP
ncbi:Protein of unknown function [Gryllus bimaculatus]|nr:Protein of unknown function [Gryllus bimaculatus]